jgi:LppP/LprE lipoprotein
VKSSGDRELGGAEQGESPPVARCAATPDAIASPLTVRCSLVWTPQCAVRRLTGLAAAALMAATLSGCGSGDSTVAKTPQPATIHPTAAPRTPAPSDPIAAPPNTSPAAPDPCAIDLAAPAIAKAVSELPRDPRSKQPWNAEPLAGNYSECAQLSAVIVKANTNAESPNTRAVMFHLGKFIPQGVPDTFGFNGMDTSESTGDTVALSYSGGIGLPSVVRFHWNGNAVELIGNTGS